MGSGRQQFRLSTRTRMGWRWRRRLLVSQKGEKEEEVSTPLTPDPSAVFSRYFPTTPQRRISRNQHSFALSPSATSSSFQCTSFAEACFSFPPFSFFFLLLPCDLYRQVHPHSPFFLRDSEKKGGKDRGCYNFSGYRPFSPST